MASEDSGENGKDLTQAMESSVSSHNVEEMRNLLKKLNRPYVKSIKLPDGNIIDCVPINLQIAFDDPLLKNHTIQMQPSSYPEGFRMTRSANEKPLTQPWQKYGCCPKGTIPIRRTRMEDLLRASSLERYGKKDPGSYPFPDSPPSGQTNAEEHEHGIRFGNGGEFSGAKATMNVRDPSVQEEGKFS